MARAKSGFRLVRFVAVALACAFFVWPAPASAPETAVVVNGKSVFLPEHRSDILDALRDAHIRPRAGFMHAFVTGQPLAERMDPPKIWRNRTPAAMTARLAEHDRVRVVDGADFVEPVTESVVPIAPAPPPDVEFAVWSLGTPGVATRRVGQMSGQTADNVVTPPQPAAPTPGPVVLFSFDDGPEPQSTPQILDILRDHGVKAVFCLVGIQIHKFPDLVKRIHDEGHALCDHTESHDMYMSTKPTDYAASQIDAPFDEIKTITGAAPTYYRGPGGDLSPFIIGEAHRLGMRVLGWSIDSMDYRRRGAGIIQNRIIGGLNPGAVVLMHDGGGDRSQTVAQLPSLIDRVRAAGYTLVAP